MKKWLAFALALMMLLSFAACGEKNSAPDGEEDPASADGQNTARSEPYDSDAAEAEKKPDIAEHMNFTSEAELVSVEKALRSALRKGRFSPSFPGRCALALSHLSRKFTPSFFRCLRHAALPLKPAENRIKFRFSAVKPPRFHCNVTPDMI